MFDVIVTHVSHFEPFRVWAWITLDISTKSVHYGSEVSEKRHNKTRPNLARAVQWPDDQCPGWGWGRAMMGWSLPPVMRSRHQLANRLRSLELHTTSDSFIITMFGVVQQWILTGHRIYWNYLHVFNSYHQVTTHATIPLIAFDIIINSWLNSMII